MKHNWKKLAAAVLLVLIAVCSRYESLRSQPVLAADQTPCRIVIDPGHGGEDGGATGVAGTRESDLNLAVSLRLQALLRLFGHEPVMVRTRVTLMVEDTAV